jgi:tRNA pseudouridine38-40 synthase
MQNQTTTGQAKENKSALPRWRATCAYDGGEFLGWQSQKGGGTVQDFLEERLKEIFHRPVRIHGSGRTDAGVHARAQVFHFEAEWVHPVEHLARALRSGLPRGLQVAAVKRAKPDFHARYSAKGKRYRYRIYQGHATPFEERYCWSLGNRTLDVAAMRAGAKRLEGKHDFTAFAARSDEDENPVKDLRRLEVVQRGRRVDVVLEGSGFLYKMARGLTGALVAVGLGKLTAADVERMLRERKRTHEVQTAPAVGLFLEKVFY